MSFLSKLFLLLLSTLVSFLLAILALDIAFWLKEGSFFYQTIGSAADTVSQSIYRDAPTRKSENTFRVLTLGGSTTYGLGLAPRDTWPKLLESKVRTIKAAEDVRPFEVEVLNLGYLGGHLEQIETGFRALPNKRISRKDWLAGERETEDAVSPLRLQDLAADVLILTPVVNDTVPDYYYESGFADELCRDLMSVSVISRSALRYYVCKFAALRGSRNDTAFDKERAERILDSFGKRLQRLIERLEREAVVDREKIVLVSLPFLFQQGDGERQAQRASRYWGSGDIAPLVSQATLYPLILSMEREMIESVARRNDIRYINLSDLFSGMRFRKRLLLFDDSIHTNARGTKKLADALWDSLETETPALFSELSPESLSGIPAD